MHAVRQQLRPKHQVLILKCYPRYQKGVSEVKANSSELSYLLYYASTRRSKIAKVGAYLEHKTEHDVPRSRLGNVQVTLQILRGLMDKSPRDISLYAPYLLRILMLILASKDISMVEDTIPTFETFCEHLDHATLVADQQLARLYEGVVKAYAGFAEKAPNTGRPATATIAIRWKNAGLKALKGISATDTTAIDGGRQLAAIIPVLLNNLNSEDEAVLTSLYNKSGLQKDTPPKRRGSVSLSKASLQVERPATILSDTTAGADREAAEEAAILALHSLKQIFSANNRAQIRQATSHVLTFLTADAVAERPATAVSTKSRTKMRWPTTLIEMIATWTPVQDRFVIVVTAMERLSRFAPSEENLAKQLIIARLIEYLLGSSINMIGLSVMDILLGLIQQVLVVLQVSGKGNNILPMHQRMSAIDLFTEDKEETEASKSDSDQAEIATEPSATRHELLKTMENCMANLATHIYYGDQISDIVMAILSRLKPSSAPGILNTVAAVERPAAVAQAIADSADIKDDPNTDEFFSFGTARVIALNAVKQVLIIANQRNTSAGANVIGRNKVTVRVWEGSQWLLRDDDRRVRRAYIGALLTWLSLELNKKDLRLREDKITNKKNKQDGSPRIASNMARTASKPERAKSLKTTFLQLCHLAAYDNVLEGPEDNNNILLMHLLLTSLTEKLGVNATSIGLPMILRLQEDINASSALSTPKSKVNVGSLVHGYLLSLSRVFDFESTMPGFEIGNEISRRKKAGLWLQSVQVPTLPLDKITAAAISSSTISDEVIKTEALKPFDGVEALVNQLSIGYSNQISASPQSPPQSPSRGISVMSTSSILGHKPSDHELPAEFKAVLLAPWTKEACIAAIEKTSKSLSPHGSRSGTTGSAGNGFLAAAKARSTRDQAPALLDVNDGKGSGGLAIVASGKRHRSSSANGTGPPTPTSTETRTLRIDDLKRVLAGHSMAEAMSNGRRSASLRAGSPLRNSSIAHDFGGLHGSGRTRQQLSIISTGSDSIVDAEGFESASEGDLEHPLPTPQTPASPTEVQHYMHATSGETTAPQSQSTRARSVSSMSDEDPDANARALKGELVPAINARMSVEDQEIPPVPRLPDGIQAISPTQRERPEFPTSTTTIVQPRERSTPRSNLTTKRSVPQNLRTNKLASDTSSVTSDRMMLVHSLLNSIEVDDHAEETSIGRPPY